MPLSRQTVQSIKIKINQSKNKKINQLKGIKITKSRPVRYSWLQPFTLLNKPRNEFLLACQRYLLQAIYHEYCLLGKGPTRFVSLQ